MSSGTNHNGLPARWVVGNPNNVVTAPIGAIGIDINTGDLYRNTNGSTGWALGSLVDEGDTLQAPYDQLLMGDGTPAGPPEATPVLAESGAGLLTGVYQYAYYESDNRGTTSLSPAASINVTSKKVRVTIGLPRRGMGERVLCRTKAGGSTFYKVHNFGGGFHYFTTDWIDNVEDTSLVDPAPVLDTTAMYTMDFNDEGIKVVRTHPDVVGPADLTLLTGDPSQAGAYAMDAYGTLVSRTANGDGVESIKTGTYGYNHYSAYRVPNLDPAAGLDPDDNASLVWRVYENGAMHSTLDTPLTDGGDGAYALLVTATQPAVTTGTHTGVAFAITGAGSSSQTQNAVSTNLAAGYTGSSPTYALTSTNNTAGSGRVVGVYGLANGAGTGQNVGLQGVAQGASHNVGVYAGFNSMTGTHDAALYVDAGSTYDAINVTRNDNGTQLLQVTNTGVLVNTQAGVYMSADGALGFQIGTNGTATGHINYYGYGASNSPGTSQFRNLQISDGKGAACVTITGSTKAITMAGPLDHDGASVGFYGTAPIAKQTGVAVTAAAIHAALVALGLISA